MEARYRVPRLTPARPRARVNTRDDDPTGHPAGSETGSDWCLACYNAGQYVLAIGPTGLCSCHTRTAALDDVPAALRSRGPDRRAATPGPGRDQGPGRARRPRPLSPTLARARARRRAAGLAYGRRRAAARVRAARFQVHPGWRGRVPERMRVVTDQPEALARVAELIDAELWSPRQRREWAHMLTAMVHAMDWDTGLIVGVTREQLAGLVGRSPTTVSRMWAWAQDSGLIARVEEGAPREWLGTTHNRSAAFVIVTDTPAPSAAHSTDLVPPASSSQLTLLVDQSGNHPTSYVSKKPLDGSKPPPATKSTRWPGWQIPTTPAERSTAATELLTRIGLDRPSFVSRRRVHGLLRPWWDQGWCIAGLMHAIDHRPDGTRLGDAVRGARDPLAVIGSRLSPWRDRHHALPITMRGIKGDYQDAQRQRLRRLTRAGCSTTPPALAAASADVRAAAKAALQDHLRELSRRRAAR